MLKEHIEQRLKDLGFNPIILDKYYEPWRFYHNLNHIINILNYFREIDMLGNDILFLSAIFHDIVYDPRRNDNELKSITFFKEKCPINFNYGEYIINIIEDTISGNGRNKHSEIFQAADRSILKEDFGYQIDYEDAIFKEYQYMELAQYVEHKIPKIAIYPGTFDPFHKGHLNILEKAERIFDKVIIAYCLNPEKDSRNFFLPNELNYRQITIHPGLLTDYIQSINYDVTVIRGIRNYNDLDYERNLLRFWQDNMSRINVTYIQPDKEFNHLSSCMLKAAEKHNIEIRKYLT
jgi:pantetheine-phosphate adenylyltransferase